MKLQEIARRVSANTEFTEYDQVGTFLTGGFDGFFDFGGISFKVAYSVILLCEGDLHKSALKLPKKLRTSLKHEIGRRLCCTFVHLVYEKDIDYTPAWFFTNPLRTKRPNTRC
jgi:hypothetical protein